MRTIRLFILQVAWNLFLDVREYESVSTSFYSDTLIDVRSLMVDASSPDTTLVSMAAHRSFKENETPLSLAIVGINKASQYANLRLSTSREVSKHRPDSPRGFIL